MRVDATSSKHTYLARRLYRDQEGGVSTARPIHCTPGGLTRTTTPNRGGSRAQFLLVGTSVRAVPLILKKKKLELAFLVILSQLRFHFLEREMMLGLGLGSSSAPSVRSVRFGLHRPIKGSDFLCDDTNCFIQYIIARVVVNFLQEMVGHT